MKAFEHGAAIRFGRVIRGFLPQFLPGKNCRSAAGKFGPRDAD
jgi:hypothetical protein